ncbi:hypothetical protein C1646_761735 [Rhizophagus diaphanus]|nr:hypothetical protein C1646_761735 [Rhizophagus diaphanus] [Rhizophagus sp. MUCL 43196]
MEHQRSNQQDRKKTRQIHQNKTPRKIKRQNQFKDRNGYAIHVINNRGAISANIMDIPEEIDKTEFSQQLKTSGANIDRATVMENKIEDEIEDLTNQINRCTLDNIKPDQNARFAEEPITERKNVTSTTTAVKMDKDITEHKDNIRIANVKEESAEVKRAEATKLNDTFTNNTGGGVGNEKEEQEGKVIKTKNNKKNSKTINNKKKDKNRLSNNSSDNENGKRKEPDRKEEKGILKIGCINVRGLNELKKQAEIKIFLNNEN